MRTFVIVSCLAAVAVAQFPPQVPGQHFQQFAATPHRFTAPQQAAPRPATGEFDVTAEIRSLLARHQAANPTPAPRARTAAPRRAPVQQAPVQQRAPAFPTFSVHNNFGAQQPQQAQAPRFVQASVQSVNPQIVTHNEQGQVINPKRFPGPLAHTVPAGVTGRVQNTQFTPEVAAAHRNLANAHASILKQQAALPRPRQ